MSTRALARWASWIAAGHLFLAERPVEAAAMLGDLLRPGEGAPWQD